VAIEVVAIGPDEWESYGCVPSAFTVRSILECEPVEGGLGGIVLRERRVTPHPKPAYDADDVPAHWAKRHDLAAWGVFLAKDGGKVVGGAAVAPPIVRLAGIEHREDAAWLFDIRVSSDCRRQGVGRALVAACAAWARDRGFRYLVIETQNVNVPACRLYAACGAELIEIRRFGYAHCPEVASEAMLIWQLAL
jgi:GNAT superfamily N-acetyltransferase